MLSVISMTTTEKAVNKYTQKEITKEGNMCIQQKSV